jgi:hypothetical protein
MPRRHANMETAASEDGPGRDLRRLRAGRVPSERVVRDGALEPVDALSESLKRRRARVHAVVASVGGAGQAESLPARV